MKKMLMIATVPSMIGQFNMKNIELLQNMDYEVHVACNFKDYSVWPKSKIIIFMKLLSEKGVHIHNIGFERKPAKYFLNVLTYFQVVKLLKRETFEFLHCHTPVGGVIGRLAGKRAGVTVIYTAHGFHFYRGAPLKNWIIFYSVEWISSWMTKVLICINKEDYETAKKRMHAAKISYVPGVGIDLSKYENVSAGNQNKRREFGIPADKLWILTVGELTKRKNHENLIRAVAKVEDTYLTIAGKGELEDKLTGLIRKLGVENRVLLIGYRTDVPQLCDAADVFAFPSYQEGLPVALMEAMAGGKPVICSHIRGNTDLIDEMSGGYYFEAGKVEEIAGCIRKMRDNPGQRTLFGQYNREKIVDYDINKIHSQMKEIYCALSAEGRNRLVSQPGRNTR